MRTGDLVIGTLVWHVKAFVLRVGVATLRGRSLSLLLLHLFLHLGCLHLDLKHALVKVGFSVHAKVGLHIICAAAAFRMMGRLTHCIHGIALPKIKNLVEHVTLEDA